MNTVLMFVGMMCIVLGLIMRANREGYLAFIVRPSTIVILAVGLTVLFLSLRAAKAETSDAYISPTLEPYSKCASHVCA